MLVRVVRTVLGTLLLIVSLPLLLVGGLLYYATQHQDPAGGFTAPLSTIHTGGHAVLASDVDALLRREVPFARSGQTTLRLTAETDAGAPAFVGLAPRPAAERYLAGVRHTRLTEVRLARGPLPVATSAVGGDRAPVTPPGWQQFWSASSSTGTLEWRPQELADQPLALVVMRQDGTAPLSVELTAQLYPQWLDTTAFGLLGLGGVGLLAAVAVLVRPGRRARQVVYVVPPNELPEVAAQLGVSLPRTADAGSPAVLLPGPAAAEAVEPEPVATESVEPEPVAPGSAEPGPVGGEPVAPGPVGCEPVQEWPPPVAAHVTATPVALPAHPPREAGDVAAVSFAPNGKVPDLAGWR